MPAGQSVTVAAQDVMVSTVVVQMVSVTCPALVGVGDASLWELRVVNPVTRLGVVAPGPRLDVEHTSSDVDVGDSLFVARVLDGYVASEAQVALLQVCGRVESRTLLLVSVDVTISVTAGGEVELRIVEVQVEFCQEL